jgi:hypothetical protein
MHIDIQAPAYQWLAKAMTGRVTKCPESDEEWREIEKCALHNGVTALLYNRLSKGASCIKPGPTGTQTSEAISAPEWLQKNIKTYAFHAAARELAKLTGSAKSNTRICCFSA